MRFVRAVFAPVVLAGVLAACGGEEKQAAAPAALPASCDDPAAVVQIEYLRNSPDWIYMSPQAGGGRVHWGQHTLRRCGDNEAELWLQVQYGAEQLHGETGGGYETIIRYTLERFHFRFRCTEQTYALIESQIIGPDEQVIATIPGDPDTFRPRTPGSPASQIMDTACRGA